MPTERVQHSHKAFFFCARSQLPTRQEVHSRQRLNGENSMGKEEPPKTVLARFRSPPAAKILTAVQIVGPRPSWQEESNRLEPTVSKLMGSPV
ncbi:hypothetical protein ElyMa_006025000 [Elysia marginata]|uniref:Uncharacterized protein n=1 Tax=Elysia marginata TaxID=1093978 RepID=A0AAV4GLM8_9GAST|nr:hypothetical protein ElyMa_006025000 [Elysia marginata]